MKAKIDKLIKELEELKMLARLRGDDLRREPELRAASHATADAYAYCILRLRMM